MFWWFERAGEYQRLEILEMQPATFELRPIHPDAAVTVETFSSAEVLAKRQRENWSSPTKTRCGFETNLTAEPAVH